MITEVLLLNPLYVSLFWAIVFKLQRGKGDEPKRFLGTFMLFVFVVYISHLFYFTGKNNVYIWLDCFYNLAMQSVYPLYYIYILLLTRDRKFSHSLHTKYLIFPTVVFVMTAAGYLIMDNGTEQIYIGSVLRGGPGQGRGIEYMKAVSILSRAGFIVQVLVYVHLGYRAARDYNRSILNYFSSPEERSLGWVQVTNGVLFIVSVFSITLAAIGRQNFEANEVYLLLPSLVITLVIFTIGLLGNMHVTDRVEECEIHHPVTQEEKVPEKLMEDLVSLFEKEKCYLNKDLKIWDITGRLATNRTYVSRVINNEFGLNFCSFVNRYRVEHAKKLLSDSKNMTVEEIADLSGFGSLNSLYRAFLASEKISVKEFRKRVQ